MTFPLKSLALCAAFVLASCVVQSSRPPISAGTGIDVNSTTGAVSLNTSEVPLLPSACTAGQVVSHTDAGWSCITLTYADITEAPPVDWATVSASVTSSTAWPGTISYAQLTDAPADLGTVAEDVTALQTSVGTLQTAMTTAQGNISTLQTNATTDEGNITTLQGKVTTLQTNATTDEGNITTLQGKVTTLQTNVTTAQGNISTLQTNMTTAQGNITTLQGNVSTLQTAKTTDEGNISTLQTNMTTAQGNITTLQGKVTTLQTEAAAVRAVTLTPASATDGGTPQEYVVTGQITDLSGNNVSAQVNVHVKALATTGLSAFSVTTGTLVFGPVITGQTYDAVIQTTAAGAFACELTDTNAGDTVWTEATPSSGLMAGTLLTF